MKKIIAFLLIILFVLLIVIIFAINSTNNSKTKYEVMGFDIDMSNTHTLSVSNYNILENFIGSSDKSINISKRFVKFFSQEIPELKDELPNYENLSEYYEYKKEELNNEYFEIGEEDFKILCENLKNIKSNLNTDYDTCSFLEDNSKDFIDVNCYYKNDEKIELKMDKYQKIYVD